MLMPTEISRRNFIVATGASSIAVPKLSAAPSSDLLKVDGLQVDGLDAPLGVHSQTPRFSWKLISTARDLEQQAYRIGVASSAEKAAQADFDIWDSGKIVGSESFDVRYVGNPLPSRMQCHWSVTVWDNKGRSATSGVSSWEMGLITARDWTAKWIAAETGDIRADRLAGFAWRGRQAGAVARSSDDRGATFRLTFDLPDQADCTFYLITSSSPEAFLDGETFPIEPFDRNAFGPRPASCSRHALARGKHAFALHVAAGAGEQGATEPAHMGVLIRADMKSGETRYFNGDATRVVAGKPDGWSATHFDDGRWETAIASPGLGQAPFPGNGGFLMRRSFVAEKKVVSARLFIAALGAYVPILNGSRIGDACLAPEWTDFRKHVLYRTYDVTSLIHRGDNVLGAEVGDGWYGSYSAPGGRYTFGGPPLRLRAQLELHYADGSSDVVATDDHWSVARGPILKSEIYWGEDVDARLAKPGWSTASHTSDRGWEPALPIETPDIGMMGAVLPPIRVAGTIAPKIIRQLVAASAVVDFGQNFAGWVRLKMRGRSGQKIILRFAELLKADGSVDQSNLRGARAADSYILNGDTEGEIFQPQFTYHGFRYVQIDGLSDPLNAADITGIIVHSDLEETGELTLGQYVPQRLWQNGLWSQRSNFMGIPTDCPQRDERLGWMGDAHVFWDAASFNMDTAAFTRKFMMDVRDTQREDGSFPDFAPDASHGKAAKPGSSPGWSEAGVLLPWTIWQRFGDTSIIDEHWEAMVRYVNSIHAANPDMIWRNRRGFDYADWLALDAKQPGDPTSPKALVGTAMWKSSIDAMAQMASATGRHSERDQYHALSAAISSAFAKAFVRSDGTVGNGSQTSYILGLRFDLVPSALKRAAAQHLVADIQARGTLLSTGFLGTPFSLDVLSDAGYHSLVYDLLLRTAYPSWGYMIAKNATTIWERWNGDVGDLAMNSYNHYALGAVAGFMYRRIAGIEPLAPGFRRFRFDPIYDPRLPKAGAKFQSKSGLISTAWERKAGYYELLLEVPANTRCTVSLPAYSIEQVRDQGNRIMKKAIIASYRSRKIQLNVGSGKYKFDVASPVFE
jgi:alpha-L-rhamnosidase